VSQKRFRSQEKLLRKMDHMQAK
jgi:hypothetical protein